MRAPSLKYPASRLRAAGLRLGLALGGGALALSAACEPVKLPHQQPGPVGCGQRDPRETAPGMLSIAQKEAFRKQGSPDEVRPNEKGGLDWLYKRSSGSVFGEQQTVEILSFDVEGLLYGQRTELLRKVGK